MLELRLCSNSILRQTRAPGPRSYMGCVHYSLLRPLWQHIPPPGMRGLAELQPVALLTPEEKMAGLPLSSMSSSSSLVVVLPAATTNRGQPRAPYPHHSSHCPTTGLCWLHGIFSHERNRAKLSAPRASGQFEGLPSHSLVQTPLILRTSSCQLGSAHTGMPTCPSWTHQPFLWGREQC